MPNYTPFFFADLEEAPARYKGLYLSPPSIKTLRRQQYYRTNEDGAGQDFLKSVPFIKCKLIPTDISRG